MTWNDSDLQVPIATLDQDLDDDFQLLPGENPTKELKIDFFSFDILIQVMEFNQRTKNGHVKSVP